MTASLTGVLDAAAKAITLQLENLGYGYELQ